MFCLVIVFVCISALSGANVPGGTGVPSDVKIDDKIRAIARFAVMEFNKVHDDRFYFTLLEVLSAQVQVVAGYKYFVDVKLARTPCLKRHANSISCPLTMGTSQEFLCHLVYLEVPWENSRHSDMRCDA